MQVKTKIKAAGIIDNRNEILVRVQKPTQGLKVKTHIKAGFTIFGDYSDETNRHSS